MQNSGKKRGFGEENHLGGGERTLRHSGRLQEKILLLSGGKMSIREASPSLKDPWREQGRKKGECGEKGGQTWLWERGGIYPNPLTQKVT